jgi:hypothetical protein
MERAYLLAERLGLPFWCEDEAGPYQTLPPLGYAFQPEGLPPGQDHQSIRGKTGKLLTLCRPATGELRAEPVDQSTNAILHPWLQKELTALLKECPPARSARSEKGGDGKMGTHCLGLSIGIGSSLPCACCSFWTIWPAITATVW